MRLCVPATALVQNCRPSSRLECEYERFRHTGWSTKESWHVSGVYFFFLFFFFLFIFFFVRVSLECKDFFRIAGQLEFTKPHFSGQFIFHQDPVLYQTMTNLQHNTIGLKFLDFNHRILF